jgi:histone deacetylase 1/2
MMVLGGGGYTVKNVSRCWTYETAVCLNEHKSISEYLPANDYYEYYAPDYELFITKKNEPNQNSPEYINYIMSKCLQNLKAQEGAPNVPFMDVPPDFFDVEELEKKMKTNSAFHDEEEQDDLNRQKDSED